LANASNVTGGNTFRSMYTLFECTFTGGWTAYSRPSIEIWLPFNNWVVEGQSATLADDGKRWLQPLNVAGISVVVGRRSRVSGEGGTEEGVWSGSMLDAGPADDGKRVSAKTVADIFCLSEAIRGLVRKGETKRTTAPR
jgi:hypothetical protein